jgi:hypothetical protein
LLWISSTVLQTGCKLLQVCLDLNRTWRDVLQVRSKSFNVAASLDTLLNKILSGLVYCLALLAIKKELWFKLSLFNYLSVAALLYLQVAALFGCKFQLCFKSNWITICLQFQANLEAS